MLDPLPGQKTNILAGVEVLVQAAVAAGVISAEIGAAATKVIAGLLTITLALKVWRSRKG